MSAFDPLQTSQYKFSFFCFIAKPAEFTDCNRTGVGSLRFAVHPPRSRAVTMQILFVQGGGGENAHDAWDSKLVESLQRELGADYEISSPRMPDEDDPKYTPWKAALRNELEKIDEGAILVGHSIGAAILAHSLAEESPERPPVGIFLVSMPFIGKGGWSSDDIEPAPDLGSRLPGASPVYLYQGSDDEMVPPEHSELNARAIPQTVVRKLAGRDHQLDNDMSEVAADIRKLGA